MKTFLELLLETFKQIPNFIVEWLNGITKRLMIGHHYWYVTDFREIFFVIPVRVEKITETGHLLIIWELSDGLIEAYEVADPADLFVTRAAADKEAHRRNKYTKAGRHGNG